MTVKVLEHNGTYTAYRRIVRRSDNGQLYESVKRINISLPPLDESQWSSWAISLSYDQLDVGLQIFFDKWNFGNGADGEGIIYQCLLDERDRRKIEEDTPPIVNLAPPSSNPRTKAQIDALVAGPGVTLTTSGSGCVTISADNLDESLTDILEGPHGKV